MPNLPDSPRIVGIGGVFIDDIVLPTGQTYMGRLGGGVVHAMMGAALWGEQPGICATVGQGLPTAAYDHLESNLDIRGLHLLDLPQIRAWQLFEEDGTRRELYRVRETVPFIQGAQPEHLPKIYCNSQSFYLLQGFEGIRAWGKVLSGFLLWEPLQQIMIPENRTLMRDVLQECKIDLVSPNLIEAQAVYGNLPPEGLIAAMLDDGAQAVALRMGAEGSIVANHAEQHYIPTIPVSNITDQTGAGNTYCGGLLWGITSGRSWMEAGIAGAVAASFCLETVGVLNPIQTNHEERDRRYQQLLPNR